jgi:membrane protease YdiL (CAAX protease family)
VIDAVLRDMQPVRDRVLLAVTAALGGALTLIWCVLVRSRSASELVLASRGLVQPTLLSAGVVALMVVAVLVVSGVPLRELGLRRRDVPRALALLVVLYGALQLAIVVAVLVCGDRLVPAQDAPAATVGLFVAQLFGNALVEEAVFRGFLLRQLLTRARLRGGGLGAIVAATAIAAVLFALWHIPVRIHDGYRGLDLAATLVVAALGAVLVSYLYVRSGNLLIIVVLHTLFNDQAPLFASPVPAQWILCVLTIGVIMWIELAARRLSHEPGTARSPWRHTPR